MPQLLLQTIRVNDYDRLSTIGLPDCIECGCCDYVCPSYIPLTSNFRTARRKLWDIGFEKRRAERAEQRFHAREERLRLQQEATRQKLDAQVQNVDVAGTDALQELLKRTGDTGGDSAEQDKP